LRLRKDRSTVRFSCGGLDLYFQASIGINIEYSRVSLVYLKGSLKGQSVEDYATYSLEKGGLNEKAFEISSLVNEFLHTHKISSADIFIGIQRDLTIVRYIQLPLAVKENLRGTLQYEMEKYVPLSVNDIYFDFQIIEEDKAAGKLTVLLIAIKKELIDPFLDSENRLGAGISGIEISSTALVNCFSGKTGSKNAEPYAILSVKDELVELGLVKKSLLNYSRHVAIDKAGDDLPQTVSKELDLLKKTMGSDQDCLEIVACGVNDSVAELFKTREDILLVDPDLSETGLPSDFLAPAYGLALKGIRKTPMDINLLPAALRKKVSKMAYYAMSGLAGLLILMVLVWAGNNIIHHRHAYGKLEEELKRLGTDVAVINQTREELAATEARVDELNTLRQHHVPVLQILRELTREMPQDVWLSRLDITDEKGTMEGIADSASALIPVLTALPLLKDVAFLSPITKDKDGRERFRIGFKLR